MSRTYATMELSEAAYNEIHKNLVEARYLHHIHENGLLILDGILIAKHENQKQNPVDAYDHAMSIVG